MSERWTPRRILEWAIADFSKRGVESPRVDAEHLIAEALGKSRIELYLDLDRPLNEEERARIRALVERRRRLEPVAYILGYRDFYKARFKVGPGVLIPRPDTEIAVEEALRRLPKDGDDLLILDLCAGSGAIGLSILGEREGARAILSDISEEALEIARANAQALGLEERVSYAKGDLFEALDPGVRFDLIVSNPPYIPAAEIDTLAPDIREFEPRLALDGGEDGLDLHRRIAARAAEFLKPGGSLIVEGGDGQAGAIAALHREYLGEFLGEFLGDEGPRILSDYGGIERVVASKLQA